MNRYGAISRIQDIAADAAIGEDVRAVCPYCELGYGKIAIYAEDGELLKGKSTPTTTKINEPSLFPLSEEAVELLKDKYHMTEDHIRYGNVKLTKDQRLVLPIRGPRNEVPGLLIKKEKELYCGSREYASIPAKWKFLRNRNAPLAAWYRHKRYNKKNSDTLLVVEDQLSAIRLSDYTDSVAILGTDLLRAVIQDIRRHRYDTVWLALDNDAIKRAFELRRRLQGELPNMRVMYLEKDFKNMTQEEMETKLEEYGVLT